MLLSWHNILYYQHLMMTQHKIYAYNQQFSNINYCQIVILLTDLIMRAYQPSSSSPNQLFGVASKQQVIFKVEIKVNNRKKNLQVFANDTHQSLAQRFCERNGLNIDQEYIAAVQEKILNYLDGIIRNPSYDKSLKEKIRNFVIKGKSQFMHAPKQADSKRKTVEQIKVKQKKVNFHEKYTPFKHLTKESVNVSNRKNHSKQRAQENKIQVKDQEAVEQKQDKKPTNKYRVALGQNKTNYAQYKPTNRTKKKQTKDNKLDKDLLQAYEVIYKKAKQSEMKKMAKKFLQDNGIFVDREDQRVETIKANYKENIEQKKSEKKIDVKKNLSPQRGQPLIQINNPLQNIKKQEPIIRNFVRSKPKYSYLEEPHSEHEQKIITVQIPRNSDISLFDARSSRKNIHESSIIHKLDRSRTNGNYKVHEFNMDQNYEQTSRNLTKSKATKSYDRFRVGSQSLHYDYTLQNDRLAVVNPFSQAKISALNINNRKYNYL